MQLTLRASIISTALLAPPAVATASELAVQGSQVVEGAAAATLTLASTCTSPNHLEVTGIVTGGAFEACSGITAEAEVSGDVVLEAGESIALQPGFAVATGAALTARLTPSLYQDAFLTDDSPQFESVYAVRWWVNTDDFAPNGSTRFDHFRALDGSGDPEFRVVVRQGSGPEAFVQVTDDGGVVASTEASALSLPTSGWHSIHVIWQRSSGADDGTVELCVDAVDCATLTALDNDTGSIARVEWGARDLEGGSAGALHLDKFESYRNPGFPE